VTHRLFYVQCRDDECRDLIWLHPSSPIALFEPGLQAVEPVEIFACPHCGCVFDYQASAVLEVDSAVLDPYGRRDLTLRLLEFDCAEDHCGYRVTIQCPLAFHLRDDAELFLRDAKSWTFGDVHCGKGHEIRHLPPEDRCLTSLPSARWAHTVPVNNVQLNQQLSADGD